MERILYPQWRNQWEATPYPFGDFATRRNDEGDVILEGTFLDAHLYPIGGLVGLYLSAVIIDHQSATFVIGDFATEQLAFGVLPLASVLKPAGTIQLRDNYGRPAGVLVSDWQRLAVFRTWGLGTHTFTRAQTEFAATCCMPAPAIGVRGIMLDDGSVMTGHVWIVGDDGIVVSHSTDAGYQLVRIDIVGDPLTRRRLCDTTGTGETATFTTPNFVRRLRINSSGFDFTCPPDDKGNFSIIANNDLSPETVLRIRATPDGIVFEAVGSTMVGD